MKTKVNLLTVLTLIGGLSLSGCGNSDVSLVKEGTMPGYDSTTIGKVLDATFDDTSWKASESKKGVKTVTFTGKISKDLHSLVASPSADKITKVLQSTKHLPQKRDELTDIFIEAVRKLGGTETSYFHGLDKKYNCELGNVKGYNQLTPVCDEWGSVVGYMGETLELYTQKLWETGTPVEFQWVISADGLSFDLQTVASAAWKGDSVRSIIYQIYK